MGWVFFVNEKFGVMVLGFFLVCFVFNVVY